MCEEFQLLLPSLDAVTLDSQSMENDRSLERVRVEMHVLF